MRRMQTSLMRVSKGMKGVVESGVEERWVGLFKCLSKLGIYRKQAIDPCKQSCTKCMQNR
jgi:hypothetical protein